MIYLDIYVPALNDSFEFRCDEDGLVGDLCQDVYRALTGTGGGRTEGFWLCDMKRQRVLAMDRSLRDQRVIQGSRLLFL